jgi:hypothetical protein
VIATPAIPTPKMIAKNIPKLNHSVLCGLDESSKSVANKATKPKVINNGTIKKKETLPLFVFQEIYRKHPKEEDACNQKRPEDKNDRPAQLYEEGR